MRFVRVPWLLGNRKAAAHERPMRIAAVPVDAPLELHLDRAGADEGDAGDDLVQPRAADVEVMNRRAIGDDEG
jgi:hypothetical protein